MKKITNMLVLPAAVVLCAQLAQSDVLYTQDFTGTGGPVSSFGWTSNIESVKTADSVKRVAVNPTYDAASDPRQKVDAISASDYGFYAPKQSIAFNGAVDGVASEADYFGHDALFFTDAVAGLTVAGLEGLSIDQQNDATDSVIRFAIQVASQWYVSDTDYGGKNATYVTKTMSSFGGASDWRSLTLVTGDGGDLSVGATVAAPTGTITAYGFLANAGLLGGSGTEAGDHVRYDNFQVSGVIPEPATLGLVAAFGGAVLFVRRRFMI